MVRFTRWTLWRWQLSNEKKSCVLMFVPFLTVLYQVFVWFLLGKNREKCRQTGKPKVLASTDEKSAKQRWEVFCASKNWENRVPGGSAWESAEFGLLQKEMMQGITKVFFKRGMMSWLIVFWLSLLHKKKIEFFRSGRIRFVLKGFSTQKFENYACANWKLHGNSRHAVLKGKMCP